MFLNNKQKKRIRHFLVFGYFGVLICCFHTPIHSCFVKASDMQNDVTPSLDNSLFDLIICDESGINCVNSEGQAIEDVSDFGQGNNLDFGDIDLDEYPSIQSDPTFPETIRI